MSAFPAGDGRASRGGMTSGLDEVRWIALPNHHDRRGNLTIVGHDDIPFSITRIFYAWSVPEGTERGGHAHRVTQQFVIAISGQISLDLTDGVNRRSFQLESPDRGVYIPPMIWRDIDNFSSGSVCMVLASDYFQEADYFREYDKFVEAARDTR